MERSALPAATVPASILPLSVKSKTAALMLGIGTTKLEELITSGQIEAKRSGKNRLVLVASMQAYLASLPDARDVPAEPPYRQCRQPTTGEKPSADIHGK